MSKRRRKPATGATAATPPAKGTAPQRPPANTVDPAPSVVPATMEPSEVPGAEFTTDHPSSGPETAAPAQPESGPTPAQPRSDAAARPSVSPGAPAAPVRDFLVIGPDEPTQPASPGELLGLMKAWRRGRATRTIWDALSDGYVAVISAAVFGGMIVNLILKMQRDVSSCSSAECLAGRTVLPWVAAAGLGALALSFSHLFGPVLASAAEGFWLLDAPVSRRRILFKRLVSVVAGALGVGVVAGALIAVLTGSGVIGIVAWALAIGLGCAGLVAVAAAAQGAEHTRAVRVLQSLLSLVAVAALLFVVAITARWVQVRTLDATSIVIPGVIAVIGLALLIGGWVFATARLNALKRTRLVSGGALVSGMQGAAFALDFGLMRDILVEREARERGHVKPRAGAWTGLAALVWRDLQRILRFPRPLIAIVVSIVVPYAVAALGLDVLNPLISGLALCVVLVPTMGSLRVLTRTPGLARMMPFNTSMLKTASIVVPGALALLWAIAVTPAYVGIGTASHRDILTSVAFGLLTGLAGLNGAIRWTGAKQINFETPMMATGMGAVPPSMIFNLFRGLDMVIVTTALAIFGLNPLYAIGVGIIALLFLRSGGFSREELEAMQEENKRQLEAQKKAREGGKIKIQR